MTEFTGAERIAGVVFFGALTLSLVAGVMFSAYETWAIWTGDRGVTITSLVREGISNHRAVAVALTAFLLVLVGHFWR